MAERVSAGIELAFDAETETRIRELWTRVEAEGVAPLASHTHAQHRPHLSVTVADWLDVTVVRDALAALPYPTGLPVDLRCVGLFPGGVLWLGPVVTEELLTLHHEIHRALDRAGIVCWPYYRPGRWMPHCTLAMQVDDHLLGAAARLASDALPISGQLVGMDLVRHTTDAAEYHPLSSVEPRHRP
ncbi:MAG: 2'-5' RNA ligase family protein [Micromonosporaceae bacterium]